MFTTDRRPDITFSDRRSRLQELFNRNRPGSGRESGFDSGPVPREEQVLGGIHAHDTASAKKKRSAARVLRLANLLDDQFRIPIIGRRFGWDAMLGLIPIVGDFVSAGLSTLLIVEAYRAGVPKSALGRMLGRMGFDAAVGAIPIVGDVFDFFFRANRANAQTALQHIIPLLEKEAAVQSA